MKPTGRRPSRRVAPPARTETLDLSGPPGDPDTVVRLKARRGSPHPWIWRSMVSDFELPRTLLPGQLVRVVDKDGEALGRAFWSPKSTIALRMITHDPREAV